MTPLIVQVRRKCDTSTCMSRYICAYTYKNVDQLKVIIHEKVCFVLCLTGCSGDCNVPMQMEAKYPCCMNAVLVVMRSLWCECHSCYLQLLQSASKLFPMFPQFP